MFLCLLVLFFKLTFIGVLFLYNVFLLNSKMNQLYVYIIPSLDFLIMVIFDTNRKYLLCLFFIAGRFP